MGKYEHLLVPEQVMKSIDFSPRGGGDGSTSIPMRNRREHAEYLQKRFEAVRSENETMRDRITAISFPARMGTYIEFAGAPAFDLISKSLEVQNAGIRLLNIRSIKTDDEHEQTLATVYVPNGKENVLLKKCCKNYLRSRS